MLSRAAFRFGLNLRLPLLLQLRLLRYASRCRGEFPVLLVGQPRPDPCHLYQHGPGVLGPQAGCQCQAFARESPVCKYSVLQPLPPIPREKKPNVRLRKMFLGTSSRGLRRVAGGLG